MKRLKIVGLALLALFALTASATSIASAEEGLLPNASGSGEGGLSTLEDEEKSKVACTKLLIKEFKFLTEKEKDQHGTANVEIMGCKGEGLFAVETLGDEKEILLINVLFLVCLVNPAALTFGLLLQPLETEHIEEPVGKELILVKGAYIAELEGAGLAGKEFKFKLEGKEGKQEVATKCEINGKEFKHSLLAANDAEPHDTPASEKGKFNIKWNEEVKLMDT